MESYRTFEPRDAAAVLERTDAARDKCGKILRIRTVVGWVEWPVVRLETVPRRGSHKDPLAAYALSTLGGPE